MRTIIRNIHTGENLALFIEWTTDSILNYLLMVTMISTGKLSMSELHEINDIPQANNPAMNK
jgi:hypothetical protein